MGLPDRQYPNVPAPESQVPEYTGPDRNTPWNQATEGTAPQPQTENNPEGQIPGIPLTAPNLGSVFHAQA